MAIAFDAGTYAQATTGTSLTFSHTVGSGNNRVLIVCGHDISSASSVVTGFTYGGRPLTKYTELAGAAGQNDRAISLWVLMSPQSGANNVVVTAASSQNLRFSAVSYSGAGQILINGGTDTTTGTAATSISTDITTSVDNCWMFMFSKDNNGAITYTSTTSDTIRLNADAGGHTIIDTGSSFAASSNTMTATMSSVNLGALAIAILPYDYGIGLDATSSVALTATTASGNHTISGSNTVLIVATRGSTGYATGVTYNSVGMTRIADVQSGVGEYYLSLWYLIAPTTGTNTLASTVASGDVGHFAVSITGADQASQPDNSTTNTASSGTSLSTSLTTNTDNAWIIGTGSSSANTFAASTNTYFLFTQLNNVCLFIRNGALSPAGSYSVNTTGGSGTHAHIVASFDYQSSSTPRQPVSPSSVAYSAGVQMY